MKKHLTNHSFVMARWASKNVKLAVTLIVLIEGLKFGIGYYLGKNAFPLLPKIIIEIAVLSVAVFIYIVQKNDGEAAYQLSKAERLSQLQKRNTYVFLSTFLLSMLVGNYQQNLQNPSFDAKLRASEQYSQQQINADSLFNSVEKKQNLGIQKISKKQSDSVQTTDEEPKTDGLRRLGYFLLFVLGIVLSYYIIVWACSLSCSGYAVYAILLSLGGLGVFGAAFYFLLKIFRKGHIKKWREMSKSERRKEWKRYGLTTLVSSLAIVGYLLIMNLLN